MLRNEGLVSILTLKFLANCHPWKFCYCCWYNKYVWLLPLVLLSSIFFYFHCSHQNKKKHLNIFLSSSTVTIEKWHFWIQRLRDGHCDLYYSLVMDESTNSLQYDSHYLSKCWQKISMFSLPRNKILGYYLSFELS